MTSHSNHKRITAIKLGFEALNAIDPTEAERMLVIFEKMTVNSLREKALGRRSHAPEAA